jgi:hypothetical protein
MINNVLQLPHACNDTKVIDVNLSLSTVNTIALPKDSLGPMLLLKLKGGPSWHDGNNNSPTMSMLLMRQRWRVANSNETL